MTPLVEQGYASPGVLEDAVRRWVDAADAWTAWMVAAGTRPDTVALRRYQIRRLAETHLARSPWRVGTADLVAWMAGHDWSPETRKSYRAALRSFYGWACRAGHARRNPAADLPGVRVPPAVARPTPERALNRALAGACDRDRLALMLASHAGLRRAEIASLRWDDIGDGVLHVHGKGGKTRAVPLHPLLARELERERGRRSSGGHGTGYRYIAGIGGPWIFPGHRGHLTPDALGRSLARVLPGWGAHSLRHRFATRAWAGSRDLLSVQILLGHAQPSTTQRYVRGDDAALVAAVNAVT